MLQKWKGIIKNWINCYFNEIDDIEQRVSLESLLNIISHLRENFSLDESKSSILEADTVEEFLREKYPDFRFHDGSLQASSEDETYMVASLLLYFVCVNSKDLDIKHAMCSQLSSEDQETILKFSKCLMECTPVTYKDVQRAITESCSQDSSAIGPSSSHQVSETPPALRSLHGEVRRLQAALDAERFDRNYLQEELARTNLRVEKFAKDKEQYKLEIVNLKAKISMCCGQDKDALVGNVAAESTAKLMRELEEVEERLVHTQGQLDDAQYERDTYKAKIAELKQERDKWLAASQQEAARASQLSFELDGERRRAHSLAEMLAELRQHHQLNLLDSSQLECDDPDASVHSLHHNTSICSEACANVVEVQLGEERAKIVVLKQQIQSLQEQFNDLMQNNKSLEKIVSEKENDIFYLKHRIKEEIDEKNNMTIHYTDAMSKLNNEINELEQKLKDNVQQSRMVVEAKMQEIQTLQEDKLLLLQSLTDETNKLEKVIKTLKSDLDAEKASRVKTRDDYENHIMKLNEKVLNRNNELVELQNDVLKKSDKIEALHLELRNEKVAREELIAKHLNEFEKMTKKLLDSENTIKLKHDEASRLTERLKDEIDNMNKQLSELNADKQRIQEELECKITEANELNYKLKLSEDSVKALSCEQSNMTKEIQQYKLEIMNLEAKVLMCCGQDKEAADAEEAEGTAKLTKELEDVEERLVRTQGYLDDAQHERDAYKDRISQLNQEREELLAANQQEAARANQLSSELEAERRRAHSLAEMLDELHHQLNRLNSSQLEGDDPDSSGHSIHQNSSECSKTCLTESEVKLGHERAKNVVSKQHIQSLKDQLTNLMQVNQSLEKIVSEKENDVFDLKHRINEEIEEKNNMTIHYSDAMSKLNNEINELEQKLKDNTQQYRILVETKMQEIQTLQEEKLSLLQSLTDETNKLENIIKNLKSELDAEKTLRAKMRDDYENHMMKLNEKVLNRNNELVELQNDVFQKSDKIEALYLDLRNEKQARDELVAKHLDECEQLTKKLLESEATIKFKCDEAARITEKLKDEQIDNINKYLTELEADKEKIKVEFESLIAEVNDLKHKLLLSEESSKEIQLYKSEIVNLKAKISSCCKQEKYARAEDAKGRAKLTRELEEVEKRLVNAQGQLQDAQRERDTFKEKISELNQEREELLAANQQEAARANQLSSELEAERRRAHSLAEMLDELRHNTSVRSEACSKLMDVQLDKERAKVVVLEQQIQTLQYQLNDMTLENESLQKVVSEQENDISNLKDKIIEDNNNMTTHYSDVMRKLSNKINELELKLNDNIQQSQTMIEIKMQEIQTLQEDKLSLLYSLADESNKFNNIIKNLKSDLDAEKASKVKIEDDYENKMMKLNEKVLNSNNELLELQNDVFERIDEIEAMHLELKNAKHARDELVAKHHDEFEKISKKLLETENTIKLKCDETARLTERLKDEEIESINKKIAQLRVDKEKVEAELESKITEVEELKHKLKSSEESVKALEQRDTSVCSEVYANMVMQLDKEKAKIVVFQQQIENLQDQLNGLTQKNVSLEKIVSEKEDEIINLKQKVNENTQENNKIKIHHSDAMSKLNSEVNELEQKLKDNSQQSQKIIESKMQEIQTLQDEKLSLLQRLADETSKFENINKNLKLVLDAEKASIVKIKNDYQNKEIELNEKVLNTKNELVEMQNNVLQKIDKIESMHIELRKEKLAKDKLVAKHLGECEQMTKKLIESDETTRLLEVQKDEQIYNINRKLAELNAEKEKIQAELEYKTTEVNELKHKLNRYNHEDVQKALRSEEWVQAIGQKDIFAVAVSDKTESQKNLCHTEKEYREFHHQVDNTTSDLAHSSMESIKTISDLEKIIQDKNRTITTLQCDVTYLKSLIADSENKLLDVTKELEVNKENCHQLSCQLKKIVHQKNEEIAELKRQVNKMSVTENRASQIIKVSAKYQAIILRRIAEIKSNTVLKELTNIGNTANGDNELRRSLNAGTVTIEDLENFLETTDKHLKRCSEKQQALQKERDRLMEVNRIHESEIINLKKFLTELSVSFKTFSTVKELYAQKFSRVVSVQRTVRREILSLDGHINDATMCKLERGYAAVMQDLSECVMNMERWVERCIGRTISPEKIKQAFTNDEDRASFVSTTFQNTGLEVQLEELEKSFQKLLEEVVRAQKGEGARDAQSNSVMEVRAEYEDKLSRMKTKMKQLYEEHIAVSKEKQRLEVLTLERELAKTRERLAESCKGYEEHIRALTAELWSVGEKFLSKKDEVDWLKKKQRSGSLMSLQHIHSSGLVHPPEDPSRPSDTYSLRSLSVHNSTNTNKRDKEGRGLHMSDEEGEVFDNRCLKELASTPRRGPAAPRDSGFRLSELRWRNSLCPPHLKSSYPAETQFQPVLDEEDIKFSLGNTSSVGLRSQRKEVGITAYKKPGPPTPSKSAGRLSATDSELRESLRVEANPQASRKTSTPSRLRSLFRSNKNDTAEGTPRSRRLSIFRKK